MTNINTEQADGVQDDSKGDWASSDDEAINVMTAPSGSQVLDERTSAMAAASAATAPPSGAVNRGDMTRSQTAPTLGARPSRRSRPANLDLSMSGARASTTNTIPVPPPSPTPTLLTLRQALTINSPPREDGTFSPEADGDADGEEDEDAYPGTSTPATPTRERITLAEALFESRLPELPPAGSRQPQEPIIINSQNQGEGDAAPSSPRTSESHSTFTRSSTVDQANNRRRRRW